MALNKFLAAHQTYDQLIQTHQSDHPPTLSALAWGVIKEEFYDKSFYVRGSAAQALGEVGDSRSLKPLTFLLKRDEFNIVKVRAMEAMARIQDAQAIPILQEYVGSTSYLIRHQAIKSLVLFGQLDQLKSLYTDLKNSSLQVQVHAAETLGDLGQSSSVSPLRAHLQAKNSTFRVRVAEALAKCGDRSVKNMFEKTIKNGKWEDRVRSAKSLFLLGSKQDALATLRAAMRQEDWKVRALAAKVLGESREPEASHVLIKHMEDERWEVRFAVIKAMVDLGDKPAVFQLRTLLNGDDEEVRSNAAEALGEVGGFDDLFYLRQELKGLDGRARVSAAKSIIKIRRKLDDSAPK